MKISFVRVVSFGNMKDRHFELAPGLNVFYGPNEAGKSTLRSFITTTMFPKAPLKYPVQKGSDSGSMEVILENGHNAKFTKDGKRSNGTGAELCNIDDREYVSIYSMSPEDLRDVKGIEKGEIRNRFLTIPGGNDVPRAYEELDAERTKLLPDLKRSARCDIAQLIQTEHELQMTVRKLQNRESGDAHYAELAEQRDRLKAELEKKEIELKDLDGIRSAAQRATGRADDLENIRRLTELEKSLEYSENVDISQLKILDAELVECRKDLKDMENELGFLRNDLGGKDPERFIRNKDRIEHLDRLSLDYDFYRRQSEKQVPQHLYPPERSGLPILSFAGGAIAVVGAAALGLVNTIAGGAIIAAGLVIAVIGLRGRRKPTARTEKHEAETDSRVQQIEELLDSVAIDTMIQRRGFHTDVRCLLENLRKSLEYRDTEKKCATLNKKVAEAERNEKLFLEGYGGREGYGRAVSDNARLKDIRSKLEALRQSTAEISVTEIPDVKVAESDYSTAYEEYKSILAELSKTEQMLRDISGDTSVEDAITASSDAGDAVYAACYRWARLMLEKIILDEATSNAYGSRRPEVMMNADGFLSAMTDGRYRLNTDPSMTEIGIIDTRTSEMKTVKEWSNGLEDQVKLSIKMAVALGLSQEKPPVILDDVLLTSDSLRKKNACGALALLSKDIQVLYFTCDRETRDLLQMSSAKVHEV